jgi:hypothetical protein
MGGVEEGNTATSTQYGQRACKSASARELLGAWVALGAGAAEMKLLRHKQEFCVLYSQLYPHLPPPRLKTWQKAFPYLARAASSRWVPLR